MTEKTIEKELIQLENQYWHAIKNKDIEKAARMTDDPCLVAGSKGIARIDKEKFRKIMQSATYTLHDFELKEMEVRLLSADVAILAYKVHEELTVDGKPVSMDASDSSTWVKRNGRWVCALHTESVEGDPYGRDRNLAA
jgi:ketosteroid isomerase-like protein